MKLFYPKESETNAESWMELIIWVLDDKNLEEQLFSEHSLFRNVGMSLEI